MGNPLHSTRLAGEGKSWRRLGRLQEFEETKETVGNTEPVKLAGKERTEVA